MRILEGVGCGRIGCWVSFVLCTSSPRLISHRSLKLQFAVLCNKGSLNLTINGAVKGIYTKILITGWLRGFGGWLRGVKGDWGVLEGDWGVWRVTEGCEGWLRGVKGGDWRCIKSISITYDKAPLRGELGKTWEGAELSVGYIPRIAWS